MEDEDERKPVGVMLYRGEPEPGAAAAAGGRGEEEGRATGGLDGEGMDGTGLLLEAAGVGDEGEDVDEDGPAEGGPPFEPLA